MKKKTPKNTNKKHHHYAVAVGKHWPKDRQWFRNLFFFKIISHRMASLGHRCKPLGLTSSVSSVLVSRTKKRKKKRSFALKTGWSLEAEGRYECSFCQDLEPGERERETSYGLEVFISPSPLPWHDEFCSWTWICFRVLSV